MSRSVLASTSGRAGLWVVVAIVVAALGFLVLVDPLGLLGPPGDRSGDALEESALEAGTRSDAEAAGASRGGPELASLYGAGDLGGVRMRLKDVAGGKPRVDQAVRLRSRSGSETSVSSRSDGEVLFGQVTPGRGWQVLIEGQGFRAVSLVNITVEPGKTTDLGDIILGTNVVLRGRVVDASSRPVAKATVAAYLPLKGTASQGVVGFIVEQALRVPQPREEVVSDAEGRFAFATLPEGTYSVVARHPGYGTRQQNDVVVKAESAATPITVRLAEGAKVSGKVSDADGRAIPGARIVALRDQGNRFSLTSTLERDEAVSDAKGMYLLDTLVDGSSYRFGVMAEGFAAAWDQGPTEIQRAAERSFTLSRGGFIEGRVTEEGTGTPIADASVIVVVGRFNPAAMRPRGGGGGAGGAAPPSDPTTPALARTDAQGRFKVGPVLPGPVMSAVVKAPGFGAFSASTWTGNAWPDVSVDQAGTVDVQLKRGGTIGGRVQSVDGQPVAGATVVAASSGGGAAMFVGSPSTTTDAEGAYTVDGVPPGDYHVTVDAAGFAHAEAGTDAMKVTMPAEGGQLSLDVTLSAAGTVLGKVTDSRGEPVAGAQVRTRADFGRMGRGGGGMGARMVTAMNTKADLTDAQGRFRLEGVPTATEWTVEVEAEDYVTTQTERLQLKPGEVKELELTLSGGATLSGRVVGEGGAWARAARIRVGTLSADEAARPYLSGWNVDRMLDPRSFSSDDEGRFTIPNIRPGRIVIKVEHPDYVTFYKRNVVLASDQRLENHQILLSRGEVVEGVVKGADGKPLANAMVIVTSRTSGRGDEEPAPAGSEESVEPSMNGQTDADGRFRVENIPPGEWNVAIGFAAGHVGWFGASDENAIKRGVRVPARDLEFRLKAQEPGVNPFGPGPRPPTAPPPPRSTGVAPPRPPQPR
jgi:protocatechuate 3,4-dioxygenase beta subunit